MPNGTYSMASSLDTTVCDANAFDRGADPILQMLSRDQERQLAAYQREVGLGRRIDELATKSNKGERSAAEWAEYEEYVCKHLA